MNAYLFKLTSPSVECAAVVYACSRQEAAQRFTEDYAKRLDAEGMDADPVSLVVCVAEVPNTDNPDESTFAAIREIAARDPDNLGKDADEVIAAGQAYLSAKARVDEAHLAAAKAFFAPETV